MNTSPFFYQPSYHPSPVKSVITIQETEDDWEQPPLQLDNFQICPNAEPFQAFYEHKIDPDTIEKVQPSSEEVQLTGIYKGEP